MNVQTYAFYFHRKKQNLYSPKILVASAPSILAAVASSSSSNPHVTINPRLSGPVAADFHGTVLMVSGRLYCWFFSYSCVIFSSQLRKNLLTHNHTYTSAQLWSSASHWVTGELIPNTNNNNHSDTIIVAVLVRVQNTLLATYRNRSFWSLCLAALLNSVVSGVSFAAATANDTTTCTGQSKWSIFPCFTTSPERYFSSHSQIHSREEKATQPFPSLPDFPGTRNKALTVVDGMDPLHCFPFYTATRCWACFPAVVYCFHIWFVPCATFVH